MSEIALTVVIATLVLAQFFWAWNTSRLLDRLMSRDYGEFAKIEKFKKSAPAKREPVDETDDYAASQAEKANRFFSVGL